MRPLNRTQVNALLLLARGHVSDEVANRCPALENRGLARKVKAGNRLLTWEATDLGQQEAARLSVEKKARERGEAERRVLLISKRWAAAVRRVRELPPEAPFSVASDLAGQQAAVEDELLHAVLRLGRMEPVALSAPVRQLTLA